MTYSVVIRTLGNGGEKYKMLLKSIDSQSVRPEEVIVVLPFGYSAESKLGYEHFLYCEKGMVTQRAVGIDNAKSDFILVLDDDVCFESDFVEGLLSAVNNTNADFVLPYHEEDGVGLFKNLKYIFLGQRFVMWSENYRIRLAPTGGHIINLWTKKDRYYATESLNFQCFFIKTEMAKQVRIQDEKWLQDIGYAIYDDQVFGKKAIDLGCRGIFAPMVEYKHLDGGVGRNESTDRKDELKKKLYGNTRNRVIYWNRFLFQPSGFLRRVILKVCDAYATVNTFALYSVYCFFIRSWWSVPFEVFRGHRDALAYCKKNKTLVR